MNFTKHQVEQYEILADALKNFEYFSEDVESRFLMFILNIESLLPKSNIFEYVFKTDITKDKKLELQQIKKQKFDTINDNVELLKSLPNDIEIKWNQVNEHYDIIKKIELEIENIHKKMNEISVDNSLQYVEIEKIDNEISEIDNHIEESEWKIDLNSHEEFTFNQIKQKLIIEKKLNYGSI
jgi:hypothetical protein